MIKLNSFRALAASCLLTLVPLAIAIAPAGSSFSNQGIYQLATRQITIPLTGEIETALSSLEGITALTITAQFQYGSGGTTVVADIQTTLDGTTWLDVAQFNFTTSTALKYANLSGLTPKSAGAYAPLSGDGVNDGLIGNQFRAVLTSTGTYAGTVISVSLSAR